MSGHGSFYNVSKLERINNITFAQKAGIFAELTRRIMTTVHTQE